MVGKVFKTTSIVLGSGLAGIALFILCVLLYSSYGSSGYEPEIHSKFYDKEYKKRIIEALDKNEIPYRRDKNGDIHYSVSYREQVDKLKVSVSSNLPAMFKVFDLSMLENFEEYLNSRGIEYQKASIEGGFSFIVNANDAQVAGEALKSARDNR